MSEGYKFIGLVIENGKVTIPKRIREILNLQRGDLVEVIVIRKIKQEVTA